VSTPPAPAEQAGSPQRRRQAVALAGHRGDSDAVRVGLADPDGRVRATALGALRRLGALDDGHLRAAAADRDAVVRARAAEVCARWTGDPAIVVPLLETLLGDPDSRVVEAAAFATGELGERAAGRAIVGKLADVATAHPDPLCREAAVAAIGAVGDPSGLPAVLVATSDKPAVRRRAVLALAPFEGPDVDAALTRALADRDWQVRQAAEDLTGD
jgi:HEAT repeat protein